MTTNKELHHISFDSSCDCTDYDPETDTETPSSDCYGHCSQYKLDWWLECTKDFFGDTGCEREFVIDGFPTWRGGQAATVWVKNAKDFLYKMTNRLGDYYLEAWVYDDCIKIALGHHDGRGVMTVEKGEQNPTYFM